MHNLFDHLAKKVGKEALDPSGLTVVQYEISRDAQHADLRHDPDPARGAERAKLGLLGRIDGTELVADAVAGDVGCETLRNILRPTSGHRGYC